MKDIRFIHPRYHPKIIGHILKICEKTSVSVLMRFYDQYNENRDEMKNKSHTLRKICPKLCGNCAFPLNFHTRKLGEITAFYAVIHTAETDLDRNMDTNILNIKPVSV